MLQRFGDCAQGTVYERLATVKQRGSVGEYVQNFELLIAQAKCVSEEAILGYFLVGLRKSVRDTVRIQDPKRLVLAMATARHVEEAQREPHSAGNSFSRNNGGRFRGNSVVARSRSRDDPIANKRSDSFIAGNSRPTTTSLSATSNDDKPTTASPQQPKPKCEAQGHVSCPTQNTHEDEGKISALRVEGLLGQGISAPKGDCVL